jgi:hypothetical protein
MTYRLRVGDEGSDEEVPSSQGRDVRVNIKILHQRCKELARSIKNARLDPPIPFNELRSYMPPREIADELISHYLRTFESAFRVVHIPSFEKEYAEYWKNPSNANMVFVCQVFMAMAIGACFYRGPSDDGLELRSQAVRWIYAVEACLVAPGEKRRLTLAGLQAQCLTLLARQMLDVGGDLVWMSAGYAIRAAIQMGLHRDPKHFPKMSTLHMELRRRLWCTLLELDIQSMLDSGTPPTISLDDFDTEWPSNIDDAEMSEATTTVVSSKPMTILTQATIQILIAKSYNVRADIVRRMNHFRSNLSYDDVLRLGTEVNSHFSELSYLRQMHQSSQPEQKVQPRIMDYNIVEQILHRVVLLIHRLFAVKAYTDPHFYFSRKVATETALALAQPELDPDYSRMMDVGGGFLNAVVGHGAWTLCLELIKSLEDDIATYSVERNRAKRKPLKEAIRSMIELSARQIELHETNVKGHFFLSMAFAQVEAMERGTSLDDAMFEAAENSATKCFALLQGRLKSKIPALPSGISDEMVLESMIPSSGTVAEMDIAFWQDPNIEFDMGDSWLFPGLFGNSWI